VVRSSSTLTDSSAGVQPSTLSESRTGVPTDGPPSLLFSVFLFSLPTKGCVLLL